MQHPNLSDHAHHDATLIAGHAAGDLTEVDRARADALLTECGACGELRRDLVAIAAATRSVPAPATLARDLRLAPEQADRLRRGSWLRAILRPFGTAGSPIRPMATAFTSLGLVGLVVGVTLSSGTQLAGSGTALDQERDVASAAATAAPAVPGSDAQAEGALGGSAAPLWRASDGTYFLVMVASDGTYYLASAPPRAAAVDGMKSEKPTGGEPAATDGAFAAGNDGGKPVSAPTDDADVTVRQMSQPLNPLIAGSLGLLGIGLLLFVLRLASTRVR